MKHQIGAYIVTLVAILLMAGCQRTQVGQVSNPEEIRELNHLVLKAANESPDSAMLMIDSLRTDGTLPNYRCDYLRAKIYAQSTDSLWLDSAIIIGERLIDSRSGEGGYGIPSGCARDAGQCRSAAWR